ncbi:MAG: hypothetical protein KDJ29_10025 [Hyphomicrobiales bacterium]|nr:hypothetical protein [Hyphomicrobiales bacterium]
MTDSSTIRRFAAGAVLVSAATILAGCNGEYSSNLSGAANSGAGTVVGAQKTATNTAIDAEKAQSSAPVVVASMSGPKFAPVPVARPNFGDRILVVAEAGSAGKPAPEGAAIRKPIPTAATLAAARAAVRGDEDDPEPALSATDERLERSVSNNRDRESLNASLPVQTGAAPTPPVRPLTSGPAIVTTAAYAPAVMEVDGRSVTVAGTKAAGTQAQHVIKAALVTAAAASSAQPAATGGQYWRAAYPHVVTGCFDATLRNALDTIGRHFGAQVEVTSGHRTRGRRRSMHRFCRAADIRVLGVRPSRLARFARTIPGIHGVGTYRRKSIVHIDTRLQRMVWRY